MKIIFLFLFIGFSTQVLTGCKKDELIGEYEILEGTWSLAYIIQYENAIGSSVWTSDTIFATSIPKLYQLDFQRKGVLRQIIDSEVISEDRIVFKSFGANADWHEFDYGTQIYLNNCKDEDHFFAAGVSPDKMSASRTHVPIEYGAVSTNFVEAYSEYFYTKD